MAFTPGWHPEYAAAADELVRATTGYAAVRADLPYPESAYLPAFRLMMQGQAGTCFPPGTLIRMADGSERKIEELRLLEEVLTAERNTGQITALMARPHTSPLVHLQLWGHSHLRMTDEHPVLTERGYVAAKDIRIGDWVAMPRYLPARSAVLQTADHIKASRRTIVRDTVRTYSGVRGRPGVRVLCKAVPDFITLDHAAGRIFGLFLAEGSTDDQKVVWTFSDDERDTLAAELVKLLRDHWGVEAAIAEAPKQHVVRVKIYGSMWARFFEALCSSGAANKSVHPALAEAPVQFLEGLLEAWLEGDGTPVGSGVEGTTVSRDLAMAMYDIAQGLGKMPAIARGERKPNKWAASRLPYWVVKLRSKGDSYRAKLTETHTWRSVRGLSYEDYDGPVYNLTVEGDNSYVAEGIGVHNCHVHGAVGSTEDTALANGLAVYPICRRLVGWQGGQLAGGRNPSDGNSPTADILSLSTLAGGVGAAHEDLCPYTDDYRTLGSKPPADVFADATKVRVIQPVKVDTMADDQAFRLMANKHALYNGIWWPFGWDTQDVWAMSRIGQGKYGHSLEECGYALPGVLGTPGYICLRNWHGKLYLPLPPEKRAAVAGYPAVMPDHVTEFWVPVDIYAEVRGYGNAERGAVTDVDGLGHLFDLSGVLSDIIQR